MLAVDPIFFVTNEITAITSAMRKNAQWANSGLAFILGVPARKTATCGSIIEELELKPTDLPIEFVSIQSFRFGHYLVLPLLFYFYFTIHFVHLCNLIPILTQTLIIRKTSLFLGS